MKNPLVTAWEKWIKAPEQMNYFNWMTLVKRAFLAGAKAQRRIEKAKRKGGEKA